jgi:hypothetical protein
MKTLYIATIVVLASALCFPQVPVAQFNRNVSDLYIGYVSTFPDYGPQLDSYRFNGVEVAYTKSFSQHFSVVASGAGSFGSPDSVKQFSGTIGPKYNILTGRFRPYITAQAGFAAQNSNGMYAGDHHPPQRAGTSLTEDGFTYRMGAGADLQLNRKIYWRVLQFDIQPQPWGRHTPFYVNFGSGVGMRF